jgi:hypothetical protein
MHQLAGIKKPHLIQVIISLQKRVGEKRKSSVAARSPIRHVAVRHDKPTPKDANVPDSIEQQWRAALALIVLQDLLDYQFGARRHSIPSGYDLIYRLDVSEDVFLRCARSVSGASTEPGTPNAAELLACAKVWLEFEDSSTRTRLVQPLANIEETSTPVSPALSDSSQITLVGEPDEEYSAALKTKRTKCVRFSEKVAIKRFRKFDAVHPKSTFSLPSAQMLDPSSGAYERVFGPVHPNGAPRRRRHSAAARKLTDTAMARSDVETAISKMTSAIYNFNPIQSTFSVLKTVSNAVNTAYTSFSPFSMTESGFIEPWFHYGAEYDMVAPCY